MHLTSRLLEHVEVDLPSLLLDSHLERIHQVLVRRRRAQCSVQLCHADAIVAVRVDVDKDVPQQLGIVRRLIEAHLGIHIASRAAFLIADCSPRMSAPHAPPAPPRPPQRPPRLLAQRRPVLPPYNHRPAPRYHHQRTRDRRLPLLVANPPAQNPLHPVPREPRPPRDPPRLRVPCPPPLRTIRPVLPRRRAGVPFQAFPEPLRRPLGADPYPYQRCLVGRRPPRRRPPLPAPPPLDAPPASSLLVTLLRKTVRALRSFGASQPPGLPTPLHCPTVSRLVCPPPCTFLLSAAWSAHPPALSYCQLPGLPTPLRCPTPPMRHRQLCLTPLAPAEPDCEPGSLARRPGLRAGRASLYGRGHGGSGDVRDSRCGGWTRNGSRKHRMRIRHACYSSLLFAECCSM